jgi:diguanylate cyclase (GGDEF)-like protein
MIRLRPMRSKPALDDRASAASWLRSAALAVIISLLAAAVIIRLNDTGDRYHEREEALSALERSVVDATVESGLAMLASVEGEDGEAVRAMESYRIAAAELAAAPIPGGAQQVRLLRDQYVQELGKVALLVEAGRGLDAARSLRSLEEPFRSLRASIADERLAASRGERRYEQISTWSTVAAMMFAAAIAGLLAWHTERSRRKAADAAADELRSLAYIDPLTGLPNRTEFMARLNNALLGIRDGGGTLAVLFIDIDNFKSVNDTMGHAAGDLLITLVARRIEAAIRPSDTCARLGGDEFAIILDGMGDLEHATHVTERILMAMDDPFVVDDRQLSVHCSIGLAISEGGKEDADELTRNADVAMYVAKSRGKARFEIYEPSMHPDLVEQRELLDDLNGALERRELVLFYQPVVEMQTGTVVGAEALIRWQHPSRRIVPPSKFIPIAEQSGLILPIGRWVLQEACRQGALWRIRFPDRSRFSMAVNVSARQLEEPAFVDELRATLRGYNVDPQSLTLELTESMMLRDDETTVCRLRQIRELGVRIAIDDFGTGYSSLGYLQQFPVDVIKIDRSFTERLSSDGRNFEVTRSIVELGRSLGVDIVAEGIEHAGQVAAVRSLGCTHGQGYYFGRPVPADDFTKIISRSIFAPLRRVA